MHVRLSAWSTHEYHVGGLFVFFISSGLPLLSSIVAEPHKNGDQGAEGYDAADRTFLPTHRPDAERSIGLRRVTIVGRRRPGLSRVGLRRYRAFLATDLLNQSRAESDLPIPTEQV